MMLAEGEPKPHRRRTESICGAPVARFGIWVGPFQLRIIRDQLNFRINQISFDAPIDSRDYLNNLDPFSAGLLAVNPGDIRVF
jgi:hypothetical protein